MKKSNVYDMTKTYNTGDRFTYGNFEYEAVKPIAAGEMMVLCTEKNPDGNVKSVKDGKK